MTNPQTTSRIELSGDASAWPCCSTAQEGVDFVVRNFSDLHGHSLTIQVSSWARRIEGNITMEKLLHA
jgi:hypothetical protein